MTWWEPLLDSGRIPDVVIRAGIRRLLARRLREEDRGSLEAQQDALRAFVEHEWPARFGFIEVG